MTKPKPRRRTTDNQTANTKQTNTKNQKEKEKQNEEQAKATNTNLKPEGEDKKNQDTQETDVEAEVEEDKENVTVITFNNIAKAYVDLMSGIVLNNADLKEGISLKRAMIMLILENNDNELYTAYWDFHVTHINNLMTEGKALRGIDHLDEIMANRIATLYNLFRSAVRGNFKDVHVSDEKIMEYMTIEGDHHNGNTGELIEWLKRRASAVARKK